MGVRILHDKTHDKAALFCSTSDWAFGPVFYPNENGIDALGMAQAFIEWLRVDPRRLGESELQKKYSEFASMNWRECRDCMKVRTWEDPREFCAECARTCDACTEEDVDCEFVEVWYNGGKTRVREKRCAECRKEKVD